MKRKNAAAVALGRRGGKATAASRTPEQRSEVARSLNAARWGEVERCPCGCGRTAAQGRRRHPRRYVDAGGTL